MNKNVEYLSKAEEVSMSNDWFALADAQHFWMQWRVKAMLKHRAMMPPRGSLLLEIGCGNGVVVNQLEESMGYVVDGCDLNSMALSMSAPSTGRKMVYNIYDGNAELLGKYDGIILLDVLEHIDNDVDFLTTSMRYLKPGGTVIINVPAHQWLFSTYDEENGHKRRYNIAMLNKVLRSCNLTTQSIFYWCFLMLPFLAIRKQVYRIKKNKVMQTGFTPPGILAHSFFKMLMYIETALPFNMPSGTSVMAICKTP